MLNFDLEPECVDGELRAALQWIAASELGVPALYFRKNPEHNLAKVRAKVRANGGRAQRFVGITTKLDGICACRTHRFLHICIIPQYRQKNK